jgi:hypothetical protein
MTVSVLHPLVGSSLAAAGLLDAELLNGAPALGQPATVDGFALVGPAQVPPGAEIVGVLIRLPPAHPAPPAHLAPSWEPTPARRVIRPGLILDEQARRLISFDEDLRLTRLEFDLLMHFAARPGRVLTRSSLLSHVWDRDPAWASARTVDVHVLRLRRALGRDHQTALQTVRGVGYRWVP